MKRSELLALWSDELYSDTSFEGLAESQRSFEDQSVLDEKHLEEIPEQDFVETNFYFSYRSDAEAWRDKLEQTLANPPKIRVFGLKAQDWNANWRQHFRGEDVDPFWRIIPIWLKDEVAIGQKQVIWMNPSMGFGTGNHPTTQLCLEAIGKLGPLKDKTVLDFGSGSGILSIAAAKMGAKVTAVEIDEMARESADELFSLNACRDRIHQSGKLEDGNSFDFIFANILKSVLEEYSEELLKRLKPGGEIYLTGLLSEHSQEVFDHYQDKLQDLRLKTSDCQVISKDNWRMIRIKI